MPQDIVIVSGGRLGNVDFFRRKLNQTGHFLMICCDGGARHLAGAGLVPDVLIGDMDSLLPEQRELYEQQGAQLIRYPTGKDFTDTALALDYALGLRPERIQIWGALGGRIDHALANLFLLIRGKEAGVAVCLLDEYGETFVPLHDAVFENAEGCLVSLLALSSRVEGVSLEGFAYPLEEGTFELSESRGVSNIIVSRRARIHVRSGHLLVVRYWQKNVFPEAD
ncbi:MAG: thiamine diphosphokinase [Smithella sp.]|nr:thiamine diphosphokinase [Smithella sp.]